MTSSNMPADDTSWLADAGIGAAGLGEYVDAGLWPELPQMDNDDLVNTVFIIRDVRLLTFNKETGEFYIAKCVNADGEEFTCALGGVVRDKLKAAQVKAPNIWQSEGGKGVAVRLIKVMSGNYASRGYFDVIDPLAPLPTKAAGAAAAGTASKAK